MPTSDWPANRATELDQLREQVTAQEAAIEYLAEAGSLRDLEMDDDGWVRYSAQIAQEFTGTGRQRIVDSCRMMAISNPLLKRGLGIRIGYVWGQGVEVTARVSGVDGKADNAEQDAVNQVVDAFEKTNAGSLTGMLAREELERALGTDGEVFLALFTDPMTGGVKVRSVPQLEVQQIVSNPEDADEPWFYLREYVVQALPKDGQPLGSGGTTTQRVIYPALGFDPKAAGLGFKPAVLNGMPVMWDAPMVHVPVNRLDGWQRGIPDVYASVSYARLYRDFIVDWAALVKSLSKIAWKATGDTKSRAAVAAAKARQAHLGGSPSSSVGAASDAGGTAVVGPGMDLSAMNKSGATIDSESGKPLAAMIAAGLGVPVTMLLADPGVTGARATAETLDTPTILEMGMRRLLWQSVLERILQYAIASAANAPAGRELRALVGDREPVLDFAWPPLAGLDPVQLVTAIVTAASTETIPSLTIARLLLSALGVPDVDEVLAQVTNEDGSFKPPAEFAAARAADQAARMNAGQAAVDAARRGEDPASADAYGGQGGE